MSDKLYEAQKAYNSDIAAAREQRQSAVDSDARQVLGESYSGTPQERRSYEQVRRNGYSNDNIAGALNAGYSWNQIVGALPSGNPIAAAAAEGARRRQAKANGKGNNGVYGSPQGANPIWHATPYTANDRNPNPLDVQGRGTSLGSQGNQYAEFQKRFNEEYGDGSKSILQLMQDELRANGETDYYRWLRRESQRQDGNPFGYLNLDYINRNNSNVVPYQAGTSYNPITNFTGLPDAGPKWDYPISPSQATKQQNEEIESDVTGQVNPEGAPPRKGYEEELAELNAAYEASQTPEQPETVPMPDAARYGQMRGEATANELASRQNELDFVTNRYIAIGRSPEEARRLALEEVYNINISQPENASQPEPTSPNNRTYAGGNVMVTDSGTGNRPVAPAPEPKPSPEEVLEEIYRSQRVYAGGNRLVPDNGTGNRIRPASQGINTPPDPRLLAGLSVPETDSGTGTPQSKAKTDNYDPYAGYITDPVTASNFDSSNTSSATTTRRGRILNGAMESKAQNPDRIDTHVIGMNEPTEAAFSRWLREDMDSGMNFDQILLTAYQSDNPYERAYFDWLNRNLTEAGLYREG